VKSIGILAVCTIACFGLVRTTSATLVDLAVNESGTVTPALGSITTFERYDPDHSTGTGVFQPFVRIQGKGVEKGYNTDGSVEFQTKSGRWTHSIKLGDIYVSEGSFVFLLDINQSQGGEGEYLSLDVMEIYLSASPNLDSYSSGLGTLIYDLGDNWIKIDNTLFKPGSGTGDMRVLIPENPAWDKDLYLYLYSEFGGNGGFSANSGFEEWGTAQGVEIPEPATIAILGLGSMIMFMRRKKE
jgi:hypothetical protein